MSFSVLRPYDLPRMPNRPQRPLPEQKAPGFLDQIAESAGGAFGGVLEKQISDSMKNRALQKALGMVDQNLSPLEQYLQLSQAEPEARQEVMGFLGEQGKARAREKELQQEHLNKMELERQKLAPKQQQEHRETANLQNQFNRLTQIARGGNVGFKNPIAASGASAYQLFNPDYRKASAEMKSLNLAILNRARKLENQGHLTERQVQAVEDRLLRPNDTVEELEGKLAGLSQVLEVQLPEMGQEIGQQVAELPANLPKGSTAVDDSSGKRYIFNGTRWQEMK